MAALEDLSSIDVVLMCRPDSSLDDTLTDLPRGSVEQ